MRHYSLVEKHNNPLLLRVEFHNRRPWLDLEQPECSFHVRLAGNGASNTDILVRDQAGNPVPAQIAPEPWSPGPNVATDRKSLHVTLRFPGSTPLFFYRTSDEALLFGLEPQVVYPDFLFSLLREARLRYCPQGYPNFIETGTLMGHTTLHASYWFDHVYTIELSAELHAQARLSLQDRPNITCLYGNSAAVLPSLIPSLSGPSFFFLDAHWSGDDSVDWSATKGFGGFPVATARLNNPELTEGERQVPLLGELAAIAGGHKDRALVLIDDWRSLGQSQRFPGQDWTHLDRDRIIDWIARHPRTAEHGQSDPRRYFWALN